MKELNQFFTTGCLLPQVVANSVGVQVPVSCINHTSLVPYVPFFRVAWSYLSHPNSLVSFVSCRMSRCEIQLLWSSFGCLYLISASHIPLNVRLPSSRALAFSKSSPLRAARRFAACRRMSEMLSCVVAKKITSRSMNRLFCDRKSDGDVAPGCCSISSSSSIRLTSRL